MTLQFERGAVGRPSGHALIYFTTGSPEQVLATYLVIPPIALNLGKYLPPMFAANLPMNGEEVRPVPLPPVPEAVPGRDYLQRLAALRGDDLVYAGSVLDSEPQRLMLETGYAADEYGQAYERYVASHALLDTPQEIDPTAVLYSVMSEEQRLAELTKLIGALREAGERSDARGIEEGAREMRALLSTFPSKFHGEALLEAVREPGARGRRRCELLLERAYALHREDYLEVGRLDREVTALEAPPTP